MAQVKTDNSINVPVCELTLRLQLRKAGLRLHRRGYHYEILYRNQVLFGGSIHGESLSLDEVAAFCSRTLVRP
jgi:hypothetical protein